MIHSENFGRAFWLDNDNEICSAPWRKGGSVDMEQMDYLADWSDMEGVSMYNLMEIIRRLIDDKMNMYSENITRYAENITREQLNEIKGNML